MEDCKIYNEEFKKKFIEEKYEIATHITLIKIFEKAYTMESGLNKDLSNFNYEEIDQLLRSYNRKTLQSVQSVVSFLRQYIDYAIEEGRVPTRINYLKVFRGQEFLSRYVNYVSENLVDMDDHGVIKSNISLGKYITRRTLHDMMDFCVNAQDGALFGILFEGAYGVGLEEIRNLTIDDCNFDTGEIILTRTDKNGKINRRTIIIEDKEILYTLEEASMQLTYEKNNGFSTPNMKSLNTNLPKTKYIFRAKHSTDRIKTSTINARIKKIAKMYQNHFLNPRNLWVSGQIDYAIKLKKQLNKKVLERTDYEMINRRFGYEEEYWYTTKKRISEYI